jgi:hypothetical protein
MTDFFVSYTGVDRRWAEWIAFVLEEERYSTTVQEWDFRPGTNFALAMQRAAKEADRTIMVLSPAYLESGFAGSEWAAAFTKDPQGIEKKLVPVLVEKCDPGGIIGPIVHIDLTGKSEDQARTELVAGVKAERSKPKTRPAVPGHGAAPRFPGAASSAPATAPKAYMPKIRRPPTDMEKRAFLRNAFAGIARYFDSALLELKLHGKDLEFDSQQVSAVEFTAELFSRGQSVTACRLMLGNEGFGRDSITFAYGRSTFHTNSANEILSIADGEGELALGAMMSGFGFQKVISFDPKRMTSEQAAEYLWRLFVERLEY